MSQPSPSGELSDEPTSVDDLCARLLIDHLDGLVRLHTRFAGMSELIAEAVATGYCPHLSPETHREKALIADAFDGWMKKRGLAPRARRNIARLGRTGLESVRLSQRRGSGH